MSSNSRAQDIFSLTRNIDSAIGNKSFTPKNFYKNKSFDSPTLQEDIYRKSHNGLYDLQRITSQIQLDRERRRKIVDNWICEELEQEMKLRGLDLGLKDRMNVVDPMSSFSSR